MALESVDYCEDRACQILKIVMQDDKNEIKTDSLKVKGEPTVDTDKSGNNQPPTNASKPSR